MIWTTWEEIFEERRLDPEAWDWGGGKIEERVGARGGGIGAWITWPYSGNKGITWFSISVITFLHSLDFLKRSFSFSGWVRHRQYFPKSPSEIACGKIFGQYFLHD